jgi:hypothetical protein
MTIHVSTITKITGGFAPSNYVGYDEFISDVKSIRGEDDVTIITLMDNSRRAFLHSDMPHFELVNSDD